MNKNYNFIKSILIKSSKSILFYVLMYIIYQHLTIRNPFTLTLTILVMIMFKDFWNVLKQNAFKYVKSVAFITVIILLSLYSLRWGVFGYIIMVLLLVGYKLWKGRELYMSGIRDIETQLFGEPLDVVKQKNETEVKEK